MSRFVNRNTQGLTVSQEFTVIELAIGLGIAAGVYKAIKKLSADKKSESKNVKDGKSVEKLADQLIRVTTKMEKSSFIKSSVSAPFGLLGEPTSDNASDIIKHLNSITGPLRGFISKVEPQFARIRKIGDQYNDETLDEIDFDDDNETAVNRLKVIISESLKGGFDVNGFKLESNGNRIISRFDANYGKTEKSIRSPIPSQGETLLKTAGHLLDLHLRAKSLGILEYAQGESDWAPDLADMLENTLRALLTYLDNSFE